MFLNERIFQSLNEAEFVEVHFAQEDLGHPENSQFEIWKNGGKFRHDIVVIRTDLRRDEDLDLFYYSLTNSDPEFIEFLANMDEPVCYYYDTPEKREYRRQQITEIIQKFIGAVSDGEKLKKSNVERRRNEVLQ